MDNLYKKVFGDDWMKEIPVPIPNTVVKLQTAENTLWETVGEDRKSPRLYKGSMENIHRTFFVKNIDRNKL